MNSPISEHDLQAYADGRLAADRMTQVEAWLAAHPEQRAQLDAWRAQAAALHRAYDPLLDAPVPARLLPEANLPPFAWRQAAAVGWLAIGGLLGYLLHDSIDTPAPASAAQALPQRAAIAHAVFVPELRHPVEVGADQEEHLVGWLSKRLGAELRPPRLDAAGYRLVGGRLLPGEHGEVAQFMYENAARNRLTLYVQRSTGAGADTGFGHARENGIDVFYWVDGRFGYALSGATGRADMLRLAKDVHTQLAR